MTNPVVEDRLAQAAIAHVESGMLIGLGAGQTAARGIRALAESVRRGELSVRVVAGSETIEAQCRDEGLETVDFSSVESLDLLIDGADEVDRELRVLKGTRGAITRERMLAWASRRTVYMVGENKLKERVGDVSALAVAVMAFGLASTRAAIRDLGCHGLVRRDLEGRFFVTDNGNLILDVPLNEVRDLRALSNDLAAIPGVIEHGLFLDEADEILVETGDGVETLTR